MNLPVVYLAGLGVLALGLVALCAWGFRQRLVLVQRVQRLEDALRVYNAANASLGRQLAEVEGAVEALRAKLAVPAPAAPAPEARPVPTAAQRYGARPPVQPEFSDAELRLAQLIKSRLSTLRLN
jgi:hypothetical protein